MKWFKSCFAGALAAAILVSTASAHTHPGDPVQDPPFVSSWAAGEVAQAESLRLVPDALGSDYTAPIDRAGFVTLAVNYVAEQNNFDLFQFGYLTELVLAEWDEEGGFLLSPFSDVSSHNDRYGIPAYYLGIVQGDENGALNPDRGISHQEAATIAARAYTACGGELPEEAAEVVFADKADIADWARESAAAMAAWGVMQGDENNCFLPDSPCTVEHAILMFLRLYEKAPVSRVNGNVPQMFTYEQCLAQIRHWNHNMINEMASIGLTVEGDRVTFVQQRVGGVMRAPVSYYFVYRDGGIRFIDLGICTGFNLATSAIQVEDAHFSDDGKTFFCTMTLPGDAWRGVALAADGIFLHQAGVYQLTLDVDTLAGETVWIAHSLRMRRCKGDHTRFADYTIKIITLGRSK